MFINSVYNLPFAINVHLASTSPSTFIKRIGILYGDPCRILSSICLQYIFLKVLFLHQIQVQYSIFISFSIRYVQPHTHIFQLVKKAFMGPVAINTVPIRLMDGTVHQDAIVSTRIASISMAVKSLQKVYLCL